MRNQQPVPVDGGRPEEDNTESIDPLPSSFSDRTTWLGEGPPSNTTGDLETPFIASEPGPTADEVDQTQDTKSTETIAMGVIFQVLASIVIFVAANTLHGTWGQRRGRRLAAIIGIVTLILVGLAVTCRTLEKGVKVSSFILTLWWFVWATLFTTRWPFVPPSMDVFWYIWDDQADWSNHYHWAAYFACWGGAVSSLVTLLVTLRSDQDRRKPALAHQMLPYIMLAAAVQVLAASIYLAKHGRRYPGRTPFALVVGGITFIASLIVQFCVPEKFCIPGKMIPLWVLRLVVYLFALLWLILVMVVSIPPFADGSNGFWSAWGGFLLFNFWLVRLSRRGESDSLVDVSKRNVVVWFVGEALAAFLILVESTSQQLLVGNRPDRHLAAVIASITILLVSAGISLKNQDSRDYHSITWRFGGNGVTSPQLAAGSLMLWWFCWASVFTITTFGPPPVYSWWVYDRHEHGPSEEFWNCRSHWTGFLACWGGVFCSIAALSASVEPPVSRQSLPPSQQEQGGVPYIMLAATVQIMAVVQAFSYHGTRYAERLIYSLVVSVLTILAVVVFSYLIPTPYQLTRLCLVFLFTLLWTALAMSTTLVGPFSEEVANGFWSAWCGCLLFWFWLCRLGQHSSQPAYLRFSRFVRGE